MNPPATEKTWRWLTILLGAFCFAAVLASHHITDGDLWGKLAIGAYVWHFGTVPDHDLFAFTPVLPHYIEHEWGAGTIFFGVLKYFGSAGLMVLKILLAFGAVVTAMFAGRRNGCSWETLFLLAIPVAWVELLGYIPVIRSHAFTYCFFAVTLLGLENLRLGKKWPVAVLPPVLLLWSNIHGGFIAGLGIIGIYTAFAAVTRTRFRIFLATAVLCGGATLVNIYGLKFWAYLIPALLNKRPAIAEWAPLPLFANDIFNSFRYLFLAVALVFLLGWRHVKEKNWPGLAVLAVTAGLAWHSRRHAPFFGIAAMAFAGPFLQATLSLVATRLPAALRKLLQPTFATMLIYGALAVGVAMVSLPHASLEVLAPVGHDPVREVDILSRAGVSGNCATPFSWGCYCAWRLAPKIKISMDGRYETTYPESTFELNSRFYDKRGTNWDQLIRDYHVDYVILEYSEGALRPPDLTSRGYDLIWETPGCFALLCLPEHATELKRVAAHLPPRTIDPLDARIPDSWWAALRQ